MLWSSFSWCRYGIRGLVIDPYNELDHQRPLHMTETEYVSQMLTKIKRFAQHNEVHVWFVAHPRQLQVRSPFLPADQAAQGLLIIGSSTRECHWPGNRHNYQYIKRSQYLSASVILTMSANRCIGAIG